MNTHIQFSVAAAMLLGIHTHVQAQIDAGDVRRSLLDSALEARPTPANRAASSDDPSLFQINHLHAVEVTGPANMVPSVQRFWQKTLGKPVTHMDLLDFRLWLSEEGKRQGQLVFGITSKKSSATDQEVLLVTLVAPKINSIKVLLRDEKTEKKYHDLLISRLASDFKPGASVDVDGIDQHLERASFDLPLNLAATVRAIGPELVDLLIDVTEVRSEAGTFKRGLVQVNNHGLKQFGREQLTGFVEIGGLAPHAYMTLAMLTSQGLLYAKGEYETPVEALAGRIKVFGSKSRSQSPQAGQAASQSETTDAGLGLSRIENNWGDLILHSHTEISTRSSTTRLASTSAITHQVRDKQWRIGLSLGNERIRRDSLNVAGTLSVGKLSSPINAGVPEGTYVRFEARGSVHYPVSSDGRWFATLKGKAQLASTNLDSYSKMSIGGTQGVRAYTSADGVGDMGAVGSIELNHRWPTGRSAGVFYDAGRVKPNKRPVNGSFNDMYSLQAVGVQFNGNLHQWTYSAHLAKGLGGYKPAESAPATTESKQNGWRAAASISYVF